MFSKNRDRLLTTDMSRKVMAAILPHREVAPLLSDEHFSVDGTLIKAWASMKSFHRKEEGGPPQDGRPNDPPALSILPEDQLSQSEPETEPMPRPNHRNRNAEAEVDFKGERRSNAAHASTTDPEARLYKKAPSTGAVLCFMGHALMENLHGLVVQGDLTQADGRAERKAALDTLCASRLQHLRPLPPAKASLNPPIITPKDNPMTHIPPPYVRPSGTNATSMHMPVDHVLTAPWSPQHSGG